MVLTSWISYLKGSLMWASTKTIKRSNWTRLLPLCNTANRKGLLNKGLNFYIVQQTTDTVWWVSATQPSFLFMKEMKKLARHSLSSHLIPLPFAFSKLFLKLRYNWQTTLCKFKIYNRLIWYIYLCNVIITLIILANTSHTSQMISS